MKKNLTELVFILDRSGSMAGLEKDTIGGFNAMIEKQRAEEGEAFISTVLFDNVSEVIHDRVKLADVPKLTEETYYVRGCTALLDAVGDAIHHIGNVHKYAREEDRPEKTLFVITTDGMENASRRYTYDKVKAQIRRQQEQYGWEFLFLGANIDAAKEAARFGIRADRAADYHADRQGTAVIYETVSDAICHVRKCAAPLQADWKEKIDRDYQSRASNMRKRTDEGFDTLCGGIQLTVAEDEAEFLSDCGGIPSIIPECKELEEGEEEECTEQYSGISSAVPTNSTEVTRQRISRCFPMLRNSPTTRS